MYITLSLRIPEINQIEEYLGESIIYHHKIFNNQVKRKEIKGIIAWGRKKSKQVQALAKQYNLPIIYLEDGFLRSLRPGADTAPISLVKDTRGIYYDSNSESDLEYIINNFEKYIKDNNLNYQDLLKQAREYINSKNQFNLSKYNHFFQTYNFGPKEKKRILLVDQVPHDLSIEYGNASEDTFHKMLVEAIAQAKESEIFLKMHPACEAGILYDLIKKYKYEDQIKLIPANTNPIQVLKEIDSVYTVTSHLGFEALLLGKDVYCFGIPHYAGWGATYDQQLCNRRIAKPSIEDLFIAVYLLYPQYINPFTGQKIDIAEAINILQNQIEIDKKNQGEIFCFGFSWLCTQSWKRNRIRKFLASNNNKIVFPESIEHAKGLGINEKSKIFVWGMRDEKVSKLREFAHNLYLKIGRIEDGFIRSVGLGTDFVMPFSLAIDPESIYYDPSKPSKLEYILSHQEFSEELLSKAEKLRQKIIENNISKYNVQLNSLQKDLPFPKDKRIILVPGQVPKDASIIKGTEFPINSNFRLLKEVRVNNPDAFIVFKVHPDLLANNRKKDRIPLKRLYEYADYIDTTTNAIKLLEHIDEVHTMTSLTGFEGLIREKKVTLYGKPFYAGWGLTEDKLPIYTRTRKLSINELFAGALMLYPHYYDDRVNAFCRLEDVIELIITQIETESLQRKSIKTPQFFYNRLIQIQNLWQEICNTIRG